MKWKKIQELNAIICNTQNEFSLNKHYYEDGEFHPNKEVQQVILEMLNIIN